MDGLVSEAVLVHRAVPHDQYMIEYSGKDIAENDADYYFCELYLTLGLKSIRRSKESLI